jgi:microcystin-dependent protein
MPARAWLTPDVLPDETVCRAVYVPDDLHWLAAFAGALLLLADVDNWEQYGSVTPQEAADKWAEVFYAYQSAPDCPSQPGGIMLPVGSIFLWTDDSTEPDYCLFCRGQACAEENYPELFAVIGYTFGNPFPGYFQLPDLRGRVPVGEGQGTGLTYRALAEVGGEEDHALSAAEMPVHHHPAATEGDRFYYRRAGTVSNQTVSGSYQYPTALVTGDAGGDEEHNNMQPWLGLAYVIVVESAQ